MGWRKGGDTRGKPERKRGRRDNRKGREKEGEREGKIERKSEKEDKGMRKIQYILGVVKRVGGYGALSFCSHEKIRYSRYPYEYG